MKALINSVNFDKEVETKFGLMYKFDVKYGNKIASFLSKTKDQKLFIANKEAEFTETPRDYNGKTYYNIKAVQTGNSNFGRQLKREQSKYSGFAMSYAKDLVIADKIPLDNISTYTKKMFKLMVDLDKTLES